jgi:hypothetical protein
MLNMNFKIKFNFIKSTGYGDGTKDFVDETVKCISGRFKDYGFIAKKVDKSHFSVASP